jgi:hypothetical protein
MTAPTIIPASDAADINEIVAPSPRVTGGVRVAPLGTPIPGGFTTWEDFNATEALTDDFISLGRVTDDGIDKTEDRPKSDKFDWGGSLIATLQDHFMLTLKFKLLQLVNADVQKTVHGADNVSVVPATATSGTQINSKINAKLLDQGIYVIDAYYMKTSGRLVLPIARPVMVGALKWVHKDLATYELTVQAFPDSDNNTAYEYWDDGVTA